MEESQAREKMKTEGWTMVEDAGRGWRRVVPSPIPQRIVEADAIQSLIRAGFVVVAVGGGGIPVIETPDGNLVGVEAVIDKDFGSSILASMINADLFLISTAVEKVAINFNKPDQTWLDKLTTSEAKQYIEEGYFAKGSMLPKIKPSSNSWNWAAAEAPITDPEHIMESAAR